MGGVVEYTRLAVTPLQIVDLLLETAPKKSTDARAFNGETVQAEAIAPDMLAAIVDEAIRERIDYGAWNRVIVLEKATHEALINKLK
ncbi:MAG TPA: hypothetical protein VK804_05060 [Bradyrhizobium sp.]|jgi:hypothetical protein|uniref:hypothetical protein n=1 Tax=Bradyrhizobium sp. TaxID=376 RepID=UPI002C05E0D0|nr:hypothetical protein [Bradyrhizobium sp.]HTA99828.1 hypothetical protein [Bradyrhizobium sp.]